VLQLVIGPSGVVAQSNDSIPDQSKALEALHPDSNFGKILHIQPSDDSSALRDVQATDKIGILRSEGEWYEVDLETQEGIEFRGWLRGGLPSQRQAPQLPPPTPKQARKELKPIQSKTINWFWSRMEEDHGSLSFVAGFQQLKYFLTGLQDINSVSTRVTAPGYDFAGIDLGLVGRFNIMEAPILNRKLKWYFDLRYNYGFLSVTFGNNSLGTGQSVPTELEGTAYRITTHNLKASTGISWQFATWSGGDLTGNIGAGIFYLESAPDLRRTDSNQIVFTQISLLSFLQRTGLEIKFMDRMSLGAGLGLILLPSFSEDPKSAGAASFESSGLPYLIDGNFRFWLSKNWSALLMAELFQSKAIQTGTSSRLGSDYEDLTAELSYYKLLAGIGFHF